MVLCSPVSFVECYARVWSEGVDVALEVVKEEHIPILPSLSKILKRFDPDSHGKVSGQSTEFASWCSDRDGREWVGAHLARRSIAF